VIDIEIVEDRTAVARCDEGFLRLKRFRARNVHDDGSSSREYPIDVIDRPTLDAVAVCAWGERDGEPWVLTRAGLRPAALFRRGKPTAFPEPEYRLVEEIVAGVLEPGEQGMEALQRRGAAELDEEAGIVVPLERFELLGGAFFMLPGIASEKIYVLAVQVDVPADPGPRPAPAHGDGSPLEEGAVLRWRRLSDAIEACASGEIEDAKSELSFRRLRDRLSQTQSSAGRTRDRGSSGR
jgi:ADP-ribose pyrophosphatase